MTSEATALLAHPCEWDLPPDSVTPCTDTEAEVLPPSGVPAGSDGSDQALTRGIHERCPGVTNSLGVVRLFVKK